MNALKRSMVQSMPAHNPIFILGPVRFRGTISKAEVIVENPPAIAAVLPEPLRHNDHKMFIVHLEITRLLEGFPPEVSLWNEIAIHVPVIYGDELCQYVLEVFSSDMGSVISGRETYGFPKVPARIFCERSDGSLNVRLCRYRDNAGIMNFAAKALSDAPPQQGEPAGLLMGKTMLRTIVYKYIPSAVPGGPPDVEQLVTIKYGRPVIHTVSLAKGRIEILEGAPDYLKEARLSSMAEISSFDMETHVMGGEVLHDYGD